MTASDTAWRIHQAQIDWTGKVDTKAAFSFGLASAGITTTVALTADGRIFHDIESVWINLMYWSGLGLLFLGAFFASRVVIPRLKTSGLEKDAAENFIYFGHLKYWHAEKLETALETNDVIPVISRQIVAMAEIAWKKHIWAQHAFRLISSGAGMLVIASLCLVK